MAEQKATNVHWHEHSVSKGERRQLSGHKGAVLWFTGLSASGKSTVANTVDHKLHSQGKRTFVLDGDNIRMGLNKNLGFSAEDRAENIRRIGEVAKLFANAGVVALTAFISPYRADRNAARALLEPGEFIEIARLANQGRVGMLGAMFEADKSLIDGTVIAAIEDEDLFAPGNGAAPA